MADRFTCIDGDFHTTDFGTAAYDVAVYSNIAHQKGCGQRSDLRQGPRRPQARRHVGHQ